MRAIHELNKVLDMVNTYPIEHLAIYQFEVDKGKIVAVASLCSSRVEHKLFV